MTLFSGPGLRWLSEALHLCTPLTKSQDVQRLKDWISETWVNVAMVDYPYESNFLQPLPAWPVKVTGRYPSSLLIAYFSLFTGPTPSNPSPNAPPPAPAPPRPASLSLFFFGSFSDFQHQRKSQWQGDSEISRISNLGRNPGFTQTWTCYLALLNLFPHFNNGDKMQRLQSCMNYNS